MAEAAVVRLSVMIGDSAATERLRRFLPGAKRVLSRQHIAEPWHALCAAEDLLRELDEAQARFRGEVDRLVGMAAPGPEPAEEAGP